jgi:hypothetical protein
MSTLTFAEVLKAECAYLQAAYPDRLGEIARAHALIANGHVIPLGDGNAQVLSERDEGMVYEVNGTCSCPDAVYRHQHCKHASAWKLYQYVQKKLEAQVAPPVEPAHEPVSGIDPRYLTIIQGRPYVRFDGLLALAHERGLVELSTTVVTATPEFAVCQAVARFQDGMVVTDIGDATPQNVKKHLVPHFVRIAATRASARALRRALNVSEIAVEELGELSDHEAA